MKFRLIEKVFPQTATPSSSARRGGDAAVCVLGLMVGLIVALSACSSDSQNGEVFLSADPGSLEVGKAITATVVASEDFFLGNSDKEDTTEGGLTLVSFVRKDRRTALAELRAAADATVGAHELSISMGGKHAVLRVSVANPASGPGTVSALSEMTATAGAKDALLNIVGFETSFDSECKVSVEGAPGFHLRPRVVSQQRIELVYSIDKNQEPTTATVVVKDGDSRYELPFTIISASEFANTASTSVLEKGRLGFVELQNPQAHLSAETHLLVEDGEIRTGMTEVLSDGRARIPIRIPFDHIGNELELTAISYHDGGRLMESMLVNVQVMDPAYIAIIPSRLDNVEGDVAVSIVSGGCSLTSLSEVELEGNGFLNLEDWQLVDESNATAVIYIRDIAEDGAYILRVRERERERDLRGILSLSSSSAVSIIHEDKPIFVGDHILMTFVVRGVDLEDGQYEFVGDKNVSVRRVIHIDKGSFAAELKISDGGYPGTVTMKLIADGGEYNAEVELITSVL